jgi:hypothetical protein
MEMIGGMVFLVLSVGFVLWAARASYFQRMDLWGWQSLTVSSLVMQAMTGAFLSALWYLVDPRFILGLSFLPTCIVFALASVAARVVVAGLISLRRRV